MELLLSIPQPARNENKCNHLSIMYYKQSKRRPGPEWNDAEWVTSFFLPRLMNINLLIQMVERYDDRLFGLSNNFFFHPRPFLDSPYVAGNPPTVDGF